MQPPETDILPRGAADQGRPAPAESESPRKGSPSPHRRSAVGLKVIIPAYNEAGRLQATLSNTVHFLESQARNFRLVLVDNGSADDTGYVVRRISGSNNRVPVSLIGCVRPGKGAAVRIGLLSGSYTCAGSIDADLAIPLETLSAALEHLNQDGSPVIASRHSPGSLFVRHQQCGRRLGGAAFRVITSSMVQCVCDIQCGFKFFDRGVTTRAMVRAGPQGSPSTSNCCAASKRRLQDH